MSEAGAMLSEMGEDDGAEPPEATSADTTQADWRQWLVTAHHTASRDYDRTITTLASSALALSLVFIHDVAPHPGYVPLVVAAWACFAASLLAILASFLTSTIALQRDIKRLDKGHVPPKRRLSAGFTTCLNWLAMGLLITGVACFASFAAYNLEHHGSAKHGKGTKPAASAYGQTGTVHGGLRAANASTHA